MAKCCRSPAARAGVGMGLCVAQARGSFAMTRIGFMRRLIGAVLILGSVACVACATTSHAFNAAALREAKRIYAPTEWGRAEDERIADVFGTLQKHGYLLTTRKAEGDLTLKFRISGSARLEAIIELWHEHEMLLRVQSVNHGVGTWIARPAARNGRVDAVIAMLDAELGKVRP